MFGAPNWRPSSGSSHKRFKGKFLQERPCNGVWSLIKMCSLPMNPSSYVCEVMKSWRCKGLVPPGGNGVQWQIVQLCGFNWIISLVITLYSKAGMTIVIAYAALTSSCEEGRWRVPWSVLSSPRKSLLDVARFSAIISWKWCDIILNWSLLNSISVHTWKWSSKLYLSTRFTLCHK